MATTIRTERDTDRAAIRRVLEAAFPTPAEADLVDALRAAGDATVSLVAEVAGEVVGHILFSPTTLTIDDGEASAHAAFGVGLAPMAVLPAQQRSGIGSALVVEGLARCREAGNDRVVVLGHPAYYPRFGFRPASSFGLRSTYDVPDDVFLAQALRPGALDGHRGVVHYAPAFAAL